VNIHEPTQENRPGTVAESEPSTTVEKAGGDINSPGYEGSWANPPSDASEDQVSDQPDGGKYTPYTYTGGGYAGNTYTSGGYYGASYTSGGAAAARDTEALLWLRAGRIIGAALLIALLWPGIVRLKDNGTDLPGWLLVVVALLLGSVTAFVLGPLLGRRAEEKERQQRRKELDEEDAKAESSRKGLTNEQRAELERRQELAEARLREQASYLRSDAQARSAYKIVQFSAATGLALLVGAFVIAVSTTQSSLQIAAASLGAIGSATAAYVGATSLAVWERALSQLNWHDAQPLVNRQLIAAQKIAEKLNVHERQDAALESVLAARLSLAANAFSSVAHRPTGRSGAFRRAGRDRATQAPVQSAKE
jgi:hypothetical protein